MLLNRLYKVRYANKPGSSFEVTLPRTTGLRANDKVVVLAEYGGDFALVIRQGIDVDEKLLRKSIINSSNTLGVSNGEIRRWN